MKLHYKSKKLGNSTVSKLLFPRALRLQLLLELLPLVSSLALFCKLSLFTLKSNSSSADSLEQLGEALSLKN